jgi:hypothetical protein
MQNGSFAMQSAEGLGALKPGPRTNSPAGTVVQPLSNVITVAKRLSDAVIKSTEQNGVSVVALVSARGVPIFSEGLTTLHGQVANQSVQQLET